MSCNGEGPLEFLSFPRRCVALRLNGQAVVQDIRKDDLDRLQVLVAEGLSRPGAGGTPVRGTCSIATCGWWRQNSAVLPSQCTMTWRGTERWTILSNYTGIQSCYRQSDGLEQAMFPSTHRSRT